LEKLLEEAKMLKVRPKKIKGEKVLFFNPRATAQLLDFIGDAFSAETIARGESPLANKMGEEVFSKHITLSDNPLLPGGPSSHGCDEEGVKGRPLLIVDKGTFRAAVADLYWGYKLGVEGGRGYRQSPYSPPSPSYTNLTLHAGSANAEGILVLGLTGLHTASVETGDMSVILSPALEDGEHVEATLSVNVYELLRNGILGVGKEGRWVGSIYSPGLLLRAELH